MGINSDDEMYMFRAINLAAKGEGFVNPNPLAGAVIVKDGKVIAEGYHKFFGGPHAEIYALGEAGINAKGADLYVNIEPCSRYGKTPPCVDAILSAGIKRVVVALLDPNPLRKGKGVRFLKRCGIEVVTGVLEEDAKRLNEIYIKYKTKNLPFIIMKTVLGFNGVLITDTGETENALCSESRQYIKKMRNRIMGVMIGVDTLISEDPALTVRLKERPYISPKAIIIDSKLQIPEDSKLLTTIKERSIIIACTQGYSEKKRIILESLGVKIIVAPKIGEGTVDMRYLIKELWNLGIDSIIVEGGKELNYGTIESELVDKVICFITPKIVKEASKDGVALTSDIVVKDMASKKLGSDLLVEGYL